MSRLHQAGIFWMVLPHKPLVIILLNQLKKTRLYHCSRLVRSSNQQNSNRTPRNREGLGRVSVCPPVLVFLPPVTDDDNRSSNPECDQTASPHECFGNEKSKRQERPSIYSDITVLNFRDSG